MEKPISKNGNRRIPLAYNYQPWEKSHWQQGGGDMRPGLKHESKSWIVDNDDERNQFFIKQLEFKCTTVYGLNAICNIVNFPLLFYFPLYFGTVCYIRLVWNTLHNYYGWYSNYKRYLRSFVCYFSFRSVYYVDAGHCSC